VDTILTTLITYTLIIFGVLLFLPYLVKTLSRAQMKGWLEVLAEIVANTIKEKERHEKEDQEVRE
jgi:hypothetical protein